MPPTVTLASIPCPACRYPVPEPTHVGEQVKCPYCHTVSEAILQQGITIPTPVFVGLITFAATLLFGPALLATTSAGQRWMEKQIRDHIA
jgi:hypothetical protein